MLAAPQKIRLKYTYRDEIRVLTISTATTFPQLCEQLRQLTGGADRGRLLLRYRDDDDLITLNDQNDFSEMCSYYTTHDLSSLKLLVGYSSDNELPPLTSPSVTKIPAIEKERHAGPLPQLDDGRSLSIAPKNIAGKSPTTPNPMPAGKDPSPLSPPNDGVLTQDEQPPSPHHSGSKEKTTGKRFMWQKGRLLGEGASGRVYIGMNEHTAELFAVKQMLVDSEKTRMSLEREIDLMKTLSHPNIVRYLGTERRGKYLNIFLECVSGGSLSSLLQVFGCFHENVARLYTSQILQGLNYLHTNGVIHRDIKGGNILINNHGVVKLADFGCSKVIDNKESATITQSGFNLKGTTLWMAPEVISKQEYSFGSDIWSVGCTIIEMLTGQTPWAEINFRNGIQAMYYIGQGGGRHPAIPAQITEVGKTFLLKCFSSTSADRGSCEELLVHPWLATDCLHVDDGGGESLSSPTGEQSDDQNSQLGSGRSSPLRVKATPVVPAAVAAPHHHHHSADRHPGSRSHPPMVGRRPSQEISGTDSSVYAVSMQHGSHTQPMFSNGTSTDPHLQQQSPAAQTVLSSRVPSAQSGLFNDSLGRSGSNQNNNSGSNNNFSGGTVPTSSALASTTTKATESSGASRRHPPPPLVDPTFQPPEDDDDESLVVLSPPGGGAAGLDTSKTSRNAPKPSSPLAMCLEFNTDFVGRINSSSGLPFPLGTSPPVPGTGVVNDPDIILNYLRSTSVADASPSGTQSPLGVSGSSGGSGASSGAGGRTNSLAGGGSPQTNPISSFVRPMGGVARVPTHPLSVFAQIQQQQQQQQTNLAWPSSWTNDFTSQMPQSPPQFPLPQGQPPLHPGQSAYGPSTFTPTATAPGNTRQQQQPIFPQQQPRPASPPPPPLPFAPPGTGGPPNTNPVPASASSSTIGAGNTNNPALAYGVGLVPMNDAMRSHVRATVGQLKKTREELRSGLLPPGPLGGGGGGGGAVHRVFSAPEEGFWGLPGGGGGAGGGSLGEESLGRGGPGLLGGGGGGGSAMTMTNNAARPNFNPMGWFGGGSGNSEATLGDEGLGSNYPATGNPAAVGSTGGRGNTPPRRRYRYPMGQYSVPFSGEDGPTSPPQPGPMLLNPLPGAATTGGSMANITTAGGPSPGLATATSPILGGMADATAAPTPSVDAKERARQNRSVVCVLGTQQPPPSRSGPNPGGTNPNPVA